MDMDLCPAIGRHQYFASKMIVSLVAEKLDRPPTCGIEIGVYTGVTSAMLLRYFRDLHLFMVDPYLPYEVERTAEQHQAAKDQAIARTDCFSGRRKLIVERSEVAVKLIPRCFADFVFIDGDHSYEGVTNDLNNYVPRVRKGGLVICHDAKQHQVYRAVRRYCQANDIEFFSGKAKSAWFFVNTGHDLAASLKTND